MRDSAARLALLPKLSKTDLHNLWQELFQKQPPETLRRDLLIPILGYRLQELEFRSLKSDARRRLFESAQVLKANPNSGSFTRTSIKAGTRLVRQWKGKTHVVHVDGRGYEYNGSRYESLSEIARLITGTRWSGPLFFGLKQKSTANPTEAV